MNDIETHMTGYPCIKCDDARVPHEGLMCAKCEDAMCAQCDGENEQQGRDRDLCVKCAKLEDAILKHAWRLYGAVKSSRVFCEHLYRPVFAYNGVKGRCVKCGHSPSIFNEESALHAVIQAIESEAKQ